MHGKQVTRVSKHYFGNRSCCFLMTFDHALRLWWPEELSILLRRLQISRVIVRKKNPQKVFHWPFQCVFAAEQTVNRMDSWPPASVLYLCLLTAHKFRRNTGDFALKVFYFRFALRLVLSNKIILRLNKCPAKTKPHIRNSNIAAIKFILVSPRIVQYDIEKTFSVCKTYFIELN